MAGTCHKNIILLNYSTGIDWFHWLVGASARNAIVSISSASAMVAILPRAEPNRRANGFIIPTRSRSWLCFAGSSLARRFLFLHRVGGNLRGPGGCVLVCVGKQQILCAIKGK